METRELPRILCVDDEARILDALSLNLRRDYQVYTATSGIEGLAKLREVKGLAVVVSDMRMPGMDGAAFLQQVMALFPDTARILLTGEPGRDVAVNAINQGQIFRFLTKPCPPDQLRAAIDAGIHHHQLLCAERQVMQETLLGCINALIDVLAITNPTAFGRAGRIKRFAMDLAATLGYRDFWQLEAASMLSQLGYMSLAPELVDKLYNGGALTDEEQTLAAGVSQVATKLLGHIPRMEPVLTILSRRSAVAGPVGAQSKETVAAAVLALVLDYDTFTTQGATADLAIQTLRSSGRHDAELLDKFAQTIGASAECDEEIREMQLRQVRPGMVFLDDLRTDTGVLVVARGFEVSDRFIERIHNFSAAMLAEKVRVKARRLAATGTA
jgi:CheY-like chemotaxis protein